MRLVDPQSENVDGVSVPADHVLLSASRDELRALGGATRETLEAVEGWEFATRLGVTREEMRSVGRDLGRIIQETRRPE